jgi:hypothetical protein
MKLLFHAICILLAVMWSSVIVVGIVAGAFVGICGNVYSALLVYFGASE